MAAFGQTTLYWDTVSSGIGFGATLTGNWDTTTANWNTDNVSGKNATQSLWTPNATTTSAWFDGTSGTISLTAAISAGDLTFNTSGYTIQTGTGGSLTLAATSTISVTTGTATISSVLGGLSTSLTKSGAGTLVLSGANAFAGTTTVSAGALNIQNSTGLGASSAGTTVASGAALELQGGVTISAEPLSLTGTGVSAGGALRNISGTNTFGGAITLAGATRINSDAGTLTISSAITGTGQALTVGGAGNTTLSGGVNTGTGGTLTKDGAGTLTLSATSNYTGGTNVGTAGGAAAGTLALGINNALLSTGVVNVYTGTLDINSRTNTIGALTLGGGAAGTTASITGTTGVLTLGGDVTYSATNNPNGATIGANLALGAARTFNVGDSSAAATDLSVTGVISGAFALTKSGAGTLSLGGVNTYSGGTNVGSAGGANSGTLALGINNALLSTGVVNVYAGTFDIGTFTNTIGALTLGGGASGSTASITGTTGVLTLGGDVTYSATNNPNGATIGANLALGAARTFNVGDSSAAATDLSVTGVISGGFALTKSGAGTLSLGGVNTYSGGTNIGSAGGANSGTLALGINNALLSTGVVNVYGGTLDISSFTNTIGALTLGGGASGSTASITGTTGVLTLGGDVTYSATNNPNGATIGANLALGAARTFNVGDSSAAATDLSVTGVISGAFALTKTGAGTLSLGGVNTYSGGTNIGTAGGADAGTLSLGVTNALASAGLVNVYAGTLDINSRNNTIGALTLGGGASGTTASITGTTGVLTLGGGVTYSATNNPNGATISANLSLGNQSRTFTVGDSSAAAVDLAVSGNIGGVNINSAIVKSGLGTLSLSGTSTYQGTTTVSQGTLQVDANAPSGAAGALGNATSAVLVNDANTGANNTALFLGTSGLSLDRSINVQNQGTGTASLGGNFLTGTGTFSGAVALNKSATFTAAGTSNVTFSGAISGTGALTKAGDGVITLSNASNAWSGGTIVNAGALRLTTSAAALSTSNLQFNGGVLEIGLATTFSRQLGTGTSQVQWVGDGGFSAFGADRTVTLTNSAGSAGGLLTWNAGSFVPTGNALVLSSAFADSKVTVTNAIDFGAAAREVRVNNGSASIDAELSGVLSGIGGGITKSGAGTLTLSGTNTYTGVTTISGGTLAVGTIGNGGVAGNLGQASSSASNLVFNGGTLLYTGSTASTNRGFTVNASTTGGIEVQSAGTNLTSSGLIAGSGTFTKSGAGTLTLSGTGSSFSGDANVSAGSLAFGAANVFNNSAIDLTIASGASVALGGFAQSIGSLSNAGTLDFGTGGALTLGSGSSTLAGTLTGSGEIVVGLGSTLTLGSNFNATGFTITLAGGTLAVNGTTSTFGTLQLTGNSTIDFAAAANSTLRFSSLSLGSNTLSVTGWTDMQDYFYSTNSPGTQGTAPLNQITFSGFTTNDSRWLTWDQQVSPVPEPSTYGAMLIAAGLAGFGFRRWRQQRVRK